MSVKQSPLSSKICNIFCYKKKCCNISELGCGQGFSCQNMTSQVETHAGSSTFGYTQPPMSLTSSNVFLSKTASALVQSAIATNVEMSSSLRCFPNLAFMPVLLPCLSSPIPYLTIVTLQGYRGRFDESQRHVSSSSSDGSSGSSIQELGINYAMASASPLPASVQGICNIHI